MEMMSPNDITERSIVVIFSKKVLNEPCKDFNFSYVQFARSRVMTHDQNQRTYATPSIVRHYAALSELQPAEQTILDRLREPLLGMQMLDIGVGGGRTTLHFAAAVSGYIGIDASAEMITACQQRFAAQGKSFACCDVRAMSQFEENSFDFILFSFNGIDYMSHTDRLRVFQEICRVGKPGGYFCFSSHNLQALELEFDWRNQLRCNPITTYSNLVMLLLLRGFNRAIRPKQLNTLAYAVIRDESHNFRLQTYYVRPQEQLRQLMADFKDIQIYSWKTGLEIFNSDAVEANSANSDLWLYYLCVIR